MDTWIGYPCHDVCVLQVLYHFLRESYIFASVHRPIISLYDNEHLHSPYIIIIYTFIHDIIKALFFKFNDHQTEDDSTCAGFSCGLWAVFSLPPKKLFYI